MLLLLQPHEIPLSGISNSDGTSYLTVGSHSSLTFADYAVDGFLGELRVYDTALRYQQIQALYGHGSARFANY